MSISELKHGDIVELQLQVNGVRCGSCTIPDLMTSDTTMVEIFVREHIQHGQILFLATITDPPEMRGLTANFEPIFKGQIN